MPNMTLNNEKKVFYTKKRGNPDLPAIILVHGAGSSHLGWPSELRRLPDYTVYGLDLPGHGRSRLPGCDNIVDYANDLAAFMDGLQLKQAVVIGHSMGGAIAQTTALQRPDLVAGLVLIGTGARLPVSEAILDQALTDFGATLAFVNKYARARGTAVPLIEEIYKLMNAAGSETLHGDYVACNGFDMRDRLSEITAPTLVLAGTIDMMTPYKFGQFLVEHMPNAQLTTIEGGGHMMMLEQPGNVATAVTAFLQNHFEAPD